MLSEHEKMYQERQALGKAEMAKVEYVPPPELPAERVAQIQAYARKLMAKHPHMKLGRIQRKVCEYFNIKTNAKNSPLNTQG